MGGFQKIFAGSGGDYNPLAQITPMLLLNTSMQQVRAQL